MTKLKSRFCKLTNQTGIPGQAYKFRERRINRLNFACCYIQNHLIVPFAINNISSSSPSLKKRDRGNEKLSRATHRLMKRCDLMSRRYEADVYIVLRRKIPLLAGDPAILHSSLKRCHNVRNLVPLDIRIDRLLAPWRLSIKLH